MPMVSRALAAAALLASFAYLFRDVATLLVRDWATDDNFSHGFLIVPLALYLAWERRGPLMEAAVRPAGSGLVIVAGSLAMLAAGELGAELFLTRIALIAAVAGAVVFVFGWPYARILAFPLAVLLLMVPWPNIIFNQIAFPLQLQASRTGESVLSAMAIPVVREGNVIVLASTSLLVEEACSGIRSLLSLLTLGIVYGYLADERTWVRCTLAASTVPIAIATNGLRVAGTGIAAHYYGAAAAEGFFHTFSGWLIFVAAFALLLVTRYGLLLIGGRSAEGPAPAVEAFT